MKLTAALAALCLLATASAQTPVAGTPLDRDPANLRGEQVTPRTGRELPVDQGAVGLQQMLRRLNTRASLMLIVAHPDDEDGGMLTLVSRGLGARVATLTLNRGEGGQNAMTGDFEDALGLLRTQELLAADRYLGVQQMFGTEVDFGFSKTKEEAFAKWTHERVLYDAVRAVRMFRPLVIAAVFIGGVTDGHGQHQVSGEIAQEVFNAAGDPKVFPEMAAEGILPWQPLKVYARVPMQSISPQGLFDYATGQYTPARFTNYVTGEVSTTVPSVDVIVHEGATDPLLDGKSYVQFARIGLGLQKSQIGGGMRVPPAGVFDVSYHLYGSRLGGKETSRTEDSFFAGIDSTLAGISTLAPNNDFLPVNLERISTLIQRAGERVTAGDVAGSSPLLAEALQQTKKLLARVEGSSLPAGQKADVLHELRIKRVQMNDALVLALGLSFDATTHGADQPVASWPVIATELRSSAKDALTVGREWLENSEGKENVAAEAEGRHPELTPDRPFMGTLSTSSAFTYAVTRPYFDRDSIEAPVYHLRIPALRNAPATPPAITARATVAFRGIEVEIARVVHDGPQPLSLIPAIRLGLDHHAQILLPGDNSLHVRVNVAADKAVQGKLALKAPSGWTVKPATQPVAASAPSFDVVPGPSPGGASVTLTAETDATSGEHYTEGFRPVGYGELPRTNFYTPATLRVVRTNLTRNSQLRIGYLAGTGDDVPEALSSIGLKPEMLTVADLTAAKLKGFDTVVLGVRTYSAHPELHGAPTAALLAYARDGGNVVVQYQTAEFGAEDAPYPLTLGRDAERVVDETDPVQVLDAGAALMSTPNKITPEDFNAWSEERGHGFLRSWDDHYTVLTETHDPGEDPQKGGLVTTQLGKGRWTYCAFAIYRQLPEAVPGAYRLFVNLLTPAAR